MSPYFRPAVKVVPRSEEPVEFVMMPGQEDEWAGTSEMELSPLWRWLGLYPVFGWIVLQLLMIGVA